MRRLRSAGGREPNVTEVLAELALLREENARLKLERYRMPDAVDLVERIREISPGNGRRGDFGDDAWHVLAEAMLIREILLDVCQQIELVAGNLQNRLRSIAPAVAVDSSSEREVVLQVRVGGAEREPDAGRTPSANTSPSSR